MTPHDVRRKLDEIRARAGDPEIAHSWEDTLYTDVLEAIAAQTCTDPAECARLALTSQDIEFPRWYA